MMIEKKRVEKSEIINFIEFANEFFKEEGKQKLVELLEEQNIEVRICSECKKIMIEGYCIDGGMQYFCADTCLEKHMTLKEFEELFNDENSETYYTEWY